MGHRSLDGVLMERALRAGPNMPVARESNGHSVERFDHLATSNAKARLIGRARRFIGTGDVTCRRQASLALAWRPSPACASRPCGDANSRPVSVPRMPCGSAEPDRGGASRRATTEGLLLFAGGRSDRSGCLGHVLSPRPPRPGSPVLGMAGLPATAERSSLRRVHHPSIASNSSMRPSTTERPIDQKSGSVASRPKGASSSRWCLVPPASSRAKYFSAKPPGAF